jgi:hypothetical protein
MIAGTGKTMHAGSSYFPCLRIERWGTRLAEVEEASVEGIVAAGEEGGGVGAEVEGELGDFGGGCHAADGLGGGEAGEGLGFVAGVVSGDEVIDEGGVDAGRRDAVAADAMGEEIARDREGHREDGAFGHGVGEAVGEAGGGGDGGEVEDDAGFAGLHGGERGGHGEVGAADVDAEEVVEVCGRGGEDGADVGDAGGVDEDIDGDIDGDAGGGGCREGQGDGGFVGDVAGEAFAGGCEGFGGFCGGFGVEVEDGDAGSGLREERGDGVADAACAAGDDGVFAGEGERVLRVEHRWPYRT